MKTLVTFIPDNVINALGWTIFHSLWQGLIIGLILFLIFKFRPNISSQARYVMGVFALAAILISSLFTFIIAYHPVASQAGIVNFSSAGISNLAGTSGTADKLSVLKPVLSGWQQSLTMSFDFISIILCLNTVIFVHFYTPGIVCFSTALNR